MDNVLQFLSGIAVLLLAGMISELLFEKTKIPDAVWLILLGLLAGPVFQILDMWIVEWLLEYFAALTLIIVLFEGGRRLSIFELRKSVGNAFALALGTFFVSTIAVALFTWVGALSPIGLFSDWNWAKAFMVGSIVGGSSSIIIMPTFQFAKIKEKLTNMVSVESAITDAFCIVGAIIFLNIAKKSSAPSEDSEAVVLLTQNLGLGVGLGLVAGLIGILFLPFKQGKYAYPITFAGLLLFYVGVTHVNGNGALAILVLAIMMGNAGLIGKLFKLNGERRISNDVDVLHGQLSFVFKTFFFVLIGFLIRPPFTPIFFGLAIAVLLILARHITVKLIVMKSTLERLEKKLLQVCGPRGLAAGVLATLPLSEGLTGVENLATVIFSTIGFTVLYFSVQFAIINRSANAELQLKDPQQNSAVDNEGSPIQKPSEPPMMH
jgi:cell volume regulation protein A